MCETIQNNLLCGQLDSGESRAAQFPKNSNHLADDAFVSMIYLWFKEILITFR